MDIKSDLFLHLLNLQIAQFTTLYMKCELFPNLSNPNLYRRIDGLAKIQDIIDGEPNDKLMIYFCCTTWEEYKELARYALVHIAMATKDYPHTL